MNVRHLIAGLTGILLLTPASLTVVKTQGTTQTAQHGEHTSLSSGPLPEAVRLATERFRNVDDAIAAGYVRNGGCVSGPEEGAMGVHYAKFALFDDELDVNEPEVLVYEPRNGRLQLVAAEYITPAAAWEAATTTSTCRT